jgi:hypothetical protein
MNKSFAVQSSQSAHRTGGAIAMWRACWGAGIVEFVV